MGSLYLIISGASIGDPLIVQDTESLDGNLVDLARQAANTRPRRQLVESVDTVIWSEKANKHCFA